MSIPYVLLIFVMTLARIGNIEITQVDLDKFVQLKAFEGYTDTTSQNFRKEALKNLIDEKVLLLEADNEGITVSRDEINDYFNLIYREYGDKTEFEDFIKSQNLTVDEIKGKLANDLKIFKLLEKKGLIQFKLPGDLYVLRPLEIRYRLIKISCPGYLPFYKRWLQGLKAWYVWLQLKLGLSFDEAARKYSDSRTREIGGDMGVKVIEPHNRFIQIVASNKPGEVSKPFRTPYAYFIFKVEEVFPRIPVKYRDLNYVERRVILEEMIPQKISEYAHSLYDKFSVEIEEKYY